MGGTRAALCRSRQARSDGGRRFHGTIGRLKTEIDNALDSLNQDFPAGASQSFATLVEELARWNRRMNLTGIRERSAMITHHLLDSLVVRPLLVGKRILDVGTGAGFPGLPLAIAEPRRAFTLIDGNNRKIVFVQHVVAMLGLDNVDAIHIRAEDFAPAGGFDTVLARAVGPVPRLIAVAGHLVREDGVFIALKGRYPADEPMPERWRYSVKELDVPGLEPGSRHAVLLRPE